MYANLQTSHSKESPPKKIKLEDDASDDDEEDEDDEDGESYVSDEEEYTSADEDKQFQAEFKAHKRNYYIEKLEYSEVDG